MSEYAARLLKNLNGSFLFFFLILFTAPLDADEVVTGSLGDERRRAHGTVVLNNMSSGETTTLRAKIAKASGQQQLALRIDSTTGQPTQNNNYTKVANADEHLQQAFWCHQCSNELFQPGLEQQGSIAPGKREKIVQTSASQWIGTVISETGPPTFPENSTSYPAGHDNNGRLPQVAKLRIPDIVSENVYHCIDRKTASVRSPTGPPASLENHDTSRILHSGLVSSPSFATLDPSILTRTSSRSMQVILRGTPMRLST